MCDLIHRTLITVSSTTSPLDCAQVRRSDPRRSHGCYPPVCSFILGVSPLGYATSHAFHLFIFVRPSVHRRCGFVAVSSEVRRYSSNTDWLERCSLLWFSHLYRVAASAGFELSSMFMSSGETRRRGVAISTRRVRGPSSRFHISTKSNSKSCTLY